MISFGFNDRSFRSFVFRQRYLLAFGLGILLIRAAIAQPLPVHPSTDPPIQTDRPSFSASAALVPPRSLQLEAGAKRTSSSSDRKLEWGQVLLRYGLSSITELRLGLNSFNVTEQTSSQKKGLEDATLAAKFRLLSEAEGVRPAVSLLPSLSLPTGHSSISSDDAIPSLSLLLDWSLSGPFSLTSNLAWTHARSGDGNFDKFSASLLLGFQLANHLSGYAEGYVFDREMPRGDSTSFADMGLIYQITHTFTLDATLGFGLSGTETDYFFGIGLGKRW